MYALVNCPNCGSGISRQPNTCPKCGMTLPESPKKIGLFGGLLMVGGAVLVLLYVVGLAVSKKSTAPQSSREASAPAPPPTPKALGLGERGVLTFEGPKKADLFLGDDDVYDQLQTAIAAQDVVGIQDLMSKGKAFMAPPGTKVLVIDGAVFSVRVRVENGPHSGRAGWLPREFVKRSEPAL